MCQTTLWVTRTDDPNPFIYDKDPNDPAIVGTLQWAIRRSNDLGNCEIRFNIPGTGTHVINLFYELPALKKPAVINATTQPGYQWGQPAVIVDGQNKIKIGLQWYKAGGSITVNGLWLKNFTYIGIANEFTNNCIIENNVITDMINPDGCGLYITNSSNGTISGNIIGTDINYSQGLGLEGDGWGIIIRGKHAENNIIGGAGVNEGNIIAYCGYAGIHLAGKQTRYKLLNLFSLN